MTLRNQSKAYNVDDSLNDEYSVTLFGTKYPLLSKTMKGFTSKLKKAGKARFNKLFNASPDVKREYIKHVSTILNLTDRSAVGDDTSNPHKVKPNKNVGKQAPLKNVGPKVPYDQTPDSLAVFQKLARKTDPEDEGEDQTLARQEAKKQEDQRLDQAQQSEAIKQLLPQQTPKMSKGGLLKGKSHKQGGIPMNVRSKGKLGNEIVDEIEVEGGEYIVNKKSTKEFEPLLKKINQAGNEARDAEGTPQEDAKKKRLQKLKDSLNRRKFAKGGNTAQKKRKVKYDRNKYPSSKLRDQSEIPMTKDERTQLNKAMKNSKPVKQQPPRRNFSQSLPKRKSSTQNTNQDDGADENPPQPSSGSSGLVNRLSRDDNISDTSDYPIAVGKYFSKMDFSRTLAYVKNKNKNVEKMTVQQIQEMSQDLASDLQLTLKYNGDDLQKMKDQLYQLLAIKLGRDKSQSDNPNKTVGLVVDVESVFGSGSELDKNKLAQTYRAGGILDVKKYARGGTTQAPPSEPLKKAMEDEGELEKLVKRGDADFTTPKPEAQAQFSDFQNLGNTPEDESASNAGQISFKRKTFDLAAALLTVERDAQHRFAQQVDDPKIAFTRTNLFRKHKNQKQGRKNLLSGL